MFGKETVMKKKLFTLAAALTIVIAALGTSGCDMFEKKPSTSDGGTSSTSSDKVPGGSSAVNSDNLSDPEFNSNSYSSSPRTYKCGNITTQDGKRVFDSEITCGTAVVVTYHYIEGANGKLENAIPTFRPLGVTEFREVLTDPAIVGKNDLSESDFVKKNGTYTMNADKAKELLGSLAETYSFNQYWKNQKMAELVSTEKISAEEAYPRVEELFNKMNSQAA